MLKMFHLARVLSEGRRSRLQVAACRHVGVNLDDFRGEQSKISWLCTWINQPVDCR